MKCPLITAGFWADPGASEKDAIDCFKEECAWWSDSEGNCSMFLMAAYLGGLVAIGEKLLNKMPHEGQFRK